VTTLALLGWSDSFAMLWPDLAAASGTTLRSHAATPDGLAAWAAERDAVHILAAGGMETEAIAALEAVVVPARLAVVGARTDHRLAVSALRSGAGEYFALPGDIEALRSWVADASRRTRSMVSSARVRR
jgi:DNA-binding NtrC family response regulator